MKHSIYILLTLCVAGCAPSQSQDQKTDVPNFEEYWYGGEAEITSYELLQSRYGEIHRGTAVLVFVTEPFSRSKQVKLDNWRAVGEDNVSVLKMNMTKNFVTGIYPYSMMMSTFTPVSFDEYPSTFKISTSSQEWCGHTFLQLNKSRDDFHLRGYSYFESEGDVDFSVNAKLLEDELWTRIRLDADQLPQGKARVLPSTFYLRLKHRRAETVEATLTLTTVRQSAYSDSPHKKYTIEYPNRNLTIFFEESFPNRILGWEETYNGLTTTAGKIKTIKSPYWSKNSNSDRVLRKQLGLSSD